MLTVKELTGPLPGKDRKVVKEKVGRLSASLDMVWVAGEDETKAKSGGHVLRTY